MKAFWFGIAGTVFFIAATILGGLQLPGYSHIAQLISESYALDTPYGKQLRFFGFIPSGIFIFLFSVLAQKTLPKSTLTAAGFWGIGIFYGMATVLVSLFPCDEGCDKELIAPSISQLIHNLTGLLTYLLVPLCLIVLGIAALKWTNARLMACAGIIGGIMCIAFVGILSSDLQSKFAGLYQRIIEGTILAWIIMCSFYIKKLYRGNK
jgi:Protein of unknown function (DUF998)